MAFPPPTCHSDRREESKIPAHHNPQHQKTLQSARPEPRRRIVLSSSKGNGRSALATPQPPIPFVLSPVEGPTDGRTKHSRS